MSRHRGRRGRLSEIRRSVYLRIPEWIRRRDFELFTALLCFTAGVPLLLTGDVDAASLEATLPFSVVMMWAGVLTTGPVFIVAGLWRAHRVGVVRGVPWLRLEALGLRLLAYAGYLYAAIVSISYFGDHGSLPAAAFIIAAFALTCHSRATGVNIRLEDFLDSLPLGDSGAVAD